MSAGAGRVGTGVTVSVGKGSIVAVGACAGDGGDSVSQATNRVATTTAENATRIRLLTSRTGMVFILTLNPSLRSLRVEKSSDDASKSHA